MPVVISEIVTEVVLSPTGPATSPQAQTPGLGPEVVDDVVRRATERVLEVLRREWDQ